MEIINVSALVGSEYVEDQYVQHGPSICQISRFDSHKMKHNKVFADAFSMCESALLSALSKPGEWQIVAERFVQAVPVNIYGALNIDNCFLTYIPIGTALAQSFLKAAAISGRPYSEVLSYWLKLNQHRMGSRVELTFTEHRKAINTLVFAISGQHIPDHCVSQKSA